MNNETIVKNTFGAFNKKKKKVKKEESFAEKPSIYEAPVSLGAPASNNWADEDDNYGDGFNDGFIVATKLSKGTRYRKLKEENKQVIQEKLSESDGEEESESSDESSIEDATTQTLQVVKVVEKSVASKKIEKENPDDIDEILRELKLQKSDDNVEIDVANAVATNIIEDNLNNKLEIEKAAEDALAGLIPAADISKKKKSKPKKKKASQSAHPAPSTVASIPGLDPKKKVAEEEKARMEKLKKRKDKSKFNQIPEYLMN